MHLNECSHGTNGLLCSTKYQRCGRSSRLIHSVRYSLPVVLVLCLMLPVCDVEQHGHSVLVKKTLLATVASVTHPAPALVAPQMILPSAVSIIVVRATHAERLATHRSVLRNLHIHSCSVLVEWNIGSPFTLTMLACEILGCVLCPHHFPAHHSWTDDMHCCTCTTLWITDLIVCQNPGWCWV